MTDGPDRRRPLQTKPPLQPDAHTADVLSAMLEDAGCRLADDPFGPDPKASARSHFGVRLHGRSASLHAAVTGWTLPRSVLRGTAAEQDGALHRAAARQLAVQQRRRRDGDALGDPHPFPTTPTHALRVDHLLVDASCAAIADEQAESDLATVIRQLLAFAHTAEHRLQSHTLNIGATSIVERGSVRTVHMPVPILGASGATIATVMDRTVEMPGITLPMTALAALPGRPLGDLVRLHPALDGRRIETVAVRRGAIEAKLVRSDVPVDPRPCTPHPAPGRG